MTGEFFELLGPWIERQRAGMKKTMRDFDPGWDGELPFTGVVFRPADKDDLKGEPGDPEVLGIDGRYILEIHFCVVGHPLVTTTRATTHFCFETSDYKEAFAKMQKIITE